MQLRPDATRNKDFFYNLVAICIMLCFQMNFGKRNVSHTLLLCGKSYTIVLSLFFSLPRIYTEYTVKLFFKRNLDRTTIKVS